jgi:hypothetical protein
MTNLEVARNLFTAYHKAMVEHLFRNGPAPVEADYSYKHGWVHVNGEGFNHEDCFGPSYNVFD